MKTKSQRPKQRVDEFIRREGLDRLLDRTQVFTNRHKQYPNLLLLKYDMIKSPLGDPLTQQCRGIILDEAGDWKIVARGFDKFFNHGEGHAAEIDWDTARVYEKLDGSITTLYFYRDQWHVATSGSPDATGPLPLNLDKTFKQLFWQTFSELGYALPKEEGLCYMFELMTPENRIVVPHERNKLVLHGARHVTAKMAYREVPPEEVAEANGWECVKTYPIRDLEAVLSLAKSMDGIENEGFVICDRWFNRLKIKTKSYVALHHLKSSMAGKESLMSLVQANEGSEFLRYFPEYKERYWELKDKFRLLCEEAEVTYAKHKDVEGQKDFALKVKDYPYYAALFSTRYGKVTDPTTWFMNIHPRKLLKLLGEK